MTALTVLEFIEDKAKFHSFMTYNTERHAFDMEPCETTDPGIYFILDDKDVLKVGKADGRLGLRGRLNNYRYDNLKSRSETDRTAYRLYNIFLDPRMREKKLSVYILPVPLIESIFEGYTVHMSIARSIEEKLSRQAEDERHSLLLSGQH